jgi:Leucine Rich Repeat
MRIRANSPLLPILIWVGFFISARAQQVNIPDPGLNAAVRVALQKPTGPLTEADLLSLTNLLAGGWGITNVSGLEAARNLRILDLDNNSITTFPVADALTNLTILDLFGNHLSSFVLSTPLTKLAILDIAFNSLAQCSLPAGLSSLNTLFLEHNALTNFTLPAGLTQLAQLDLTDNQLGSLTLPPEGTSLTALFLSANPITTLVLSEPLAATNLAVTITNLRNQGVQVFTYPLSVRLTLPQQQPLGAFRFGLTGPPGVYTILQSTNLASWGVLGATTNTFGSNSFVDVTAPLSPRKFYRVRANP